MADGSRAETAEDFKRKLARFAWIAFICLFGLAAMFPLMPNVQGWMASTVSLFIIYIIATQGVSILTGYTGLVTVGHGGFLAIGAYTSALFSKHLGTDLLFGLLAGGLVSAAVGCILALVFLRLSGAFMAIGTLGFAFFVGTIVNNVAIFEGRDGIKVSKKLLVWQLGDVGFYYLSLATLAAVTLLIYCLVNSSVGRAMMALRDAERAAESSGINRIFYRTLAFTISAFVTGLAGVLNGHQAGFISSEVYADIWYSVDFLVAAIVGGSSYLIGPIVGGLFVALIPFLLEELRDLAFILKGAALILVLIFAPKGIAEIFARPIRNWRSRRLEALPATTRVKTRGSSKSLLRCEDIFVRFGGVIACNNVSVDVEKGKIVGLIGPNGAGKTTLFNVLSRFQPVASGRIYYAGEIINRMRPHEMPTLGVARTFQNINLFGEQTVRSNILIGAHRRVWNPIGSILRTPRARETEREINQRVDEIAALIRLEGFLDEQVKNLSYGMQKRVELARALASRPEVLLLDEPVAGCNDEETREITEIVRRINRELGVTVLLVEHDMSMVMDVCDFIYVMNFGANLASGTPEEIRRDPAVIKAYLGEAE
jgi:branched-chain amino acid transport system permease protein